MWIKFYINNRNMIWFILDALVQRIYFNKLKNNEEFYELTNFTFTDVKGRK